MIANSAVAAVSDRRRRSEIDATIFVTLYRNLPQPVLAGKLFWFEILIGQQGQV
jgi:hypothetical protein